MSDHLASEPPPSLPVQAPGRLAYPPAAVSWLAGGGEIVLDYGAGSGLLTQVLVELDRETYAVDPSEDLLAQLRASLPDVPTAVASAATIPLPDDSLDAVVCGDPDDPDDLTSALPEIARVLKPGGIVAVAFTAPDQRIPWVRRLAAILGLPGHPPDAAIALEASDLFEAIEADSFSHWEQLDRDSINEFALTQAKVPSVTESARARLLGAVGELYAEYERGIDGLRLPYVIHCVRAKAVIPPEPTEDEIADEPPLIDFS